VKQTPGISNPPLEACQRQDDFGFRISDFGFPATIIPIATGFDILECANPPQQRCNREDAKDAKSGRQENHIIGSLRLLCDFAFSMYIPVRVIFSRSDMARVF
jgi:hypothetical protein